MKPILFILLMVLSACHILSKDKQTLKKLNQKEELQISEQRNTLHEQSQLVLIDSSHNDFTMMLWPKGKFTFSIADGFEGEADKVLIKGKNTSQKMLNLKQEIKKDSTLLKANYAKQRESIATVNKSKFNMSYNWAWLLLGFVIFCLLYWLYKRCKL